VSTTNVTRPPPPSPMTGPAVRMVSSARRLLGLARSAPVTVGFVVTLWALGAATGSLLRGPSAPLRRSIGASVPALASGRVYTLLTTALWAHGLIGYLLMSAGALAVGGAIERRHGPARLLGVAVLTQTLGTAAGLGGIALLARAGGTWSNELAVGTTVGSTPLILGAWAAFSASSSVLWRRRIRLGLLVVLLTTMLYGGLLSDVLRLAAALLGLAVGAVLLRRRHPPLMVHSSRRENRVLVALLVAATAGGALLASVSPTAVGPFAVLRYLFASPSLDPARLQELCADQTSAEMCADLRTQLRFDGLGPSLLAVLPAVLVLVLADGLRRGRRFAWWAAVGLHVLLSGFGLLLAVAAVRGPARDTAVLVVGGNRGVVGVVLPLVQPLMVLVVLVVFRQSFALSAPARTYVRVAAVLATTMVVLFGGYVLVGVLVAGQFDTPPTLGQLAADFPQRLIPPGYLGVVEPTFLPQTALSTVIYEWTGVLLWAVVIAVVLHSFRGKTLRGQDESARARQVLTQHGRTALSYLTIWAGNSYWFTDTGSTFVAYRVIGGAAITTGDPIGSPTERATAIAGFVAHCRTHSWTPCFYSVTPAVVEETTRLGWPSVQVAEDTVLVLGTLAFTGKKFQDVRTAVNRAARAGITAEWITYPTASRAMTTQIRALSEEWVASKGLPEMGFTLGGLDELDDPQVRCLVAVDAEGRLHGVTSWLPVHDAGAVIGWTLDFMRRSPEGFPGVMEFLIGSAALDLQAEGAQFVSLSGAPLARVDPAIAPTGLQSLLDFMGRTLEPVYGFRSLLAFKAKFGPTYRPLYMAYPETAVLPRIANGISRAYVPRISLRQGLRMFRRH